MRQLPICAPLLIVLFAVSCAKEFSVAIKNVGSEDIYDAHIFIDQFRSAGGILPPGISATHGGIPGPIPEAVIVEWESADGVKHRERVAVPESIPRDFDGDIVFQIDGENRVTVTTEARLDLGDLR